jgi:hypothetical protein
LKQKGIISKRKALDHKIEREGILPNIFYEAEFY